jgi:hypothetical protein
MEEIRQEMEDVGLLISAEGDQLRHEAGQAVEILNERMSQQVANLEAETDEQKEELRGLRMMTFLTELTSNTATTEMILPILASVAVAMKANPLLLMIPATLSASCAFMMPVATPPNAIVFGSGRIRIAEMAKVGLAINLIGIIIISLVFYILGTAALGIDTATFPMWAEVG